MTNPVIPDEAVELALIANWDTEGDQKARMRAALAAAASYMMAGYADVFDEGIEAGRGLRPTTNPYRPDALEGK